ncbi:MAG: amidohydrolase family protein [Candidatus Thorarchaeota archaeon]
MIIDVHYHLITSQITPRDAEGVLAEPLRIAKIMKLKPGRDLLIQKICDLWSDPDGKKVIRLMDNSGVDFAIVCRSDNYDNEILTSEVNQFFNKNISEIAKVYPNRLMAFAGVDPRRPEALDMLKQCFEEFSMKGLKYHPDNGYDPSGRESYLLLDYLEKKNGILLTHTGPLGGRRSKFTDPLILADILADFPKLPVIAAHMGQINWRPWAALAAHNPNLYGDLAMWGPYAFKNYTLFCRELRDIIDYAGVEKVLFGSDSPIYDPVLSIKDVIEKIKNLPHKATKGIQFTKEEIDAILGANAEKLLGLS